MYDLLITILFLCTAISSFFGEPFTIVSLSLLFTVGILLAAVLYIVGERRLMREPLMMSAKIDSALAVSGSHAIKTLFKLQLIE